MKPVKKVAPKTETPKKPAESAKKAPAQIGLVRGMRDLLPQDQPIWDLMRDKARELAKSYNFDRIDTPLLEETNLFVRGVGKQTDIVEKELFSFDTLGGEHVSLRPESTASTMRAYIHHGMLNQSQPVKLWSVGPMFRHDRPQHNRYRQFQQFACEIIGDANAVIDAQLILVSYLFLKELGVEATVHINSIGTPESRVNYKNALVSYFRTKRNKLSEEDKKRLLKNPMRLLDSKEPGMQELKAEAPQIVDWLDEESKAHFMRVLEYLDELNIPYQLDPYLVRGLDYYTRTVFEFYSSSTDPELAQSALGGGGRYDGLAEILGGRPTPAAGFAIGMDRVFNQLKETAVAQQPTCEIFVAHLGDQGRKRALAVFEELRKAGLRAGEAFAKDAIKAQMEMANRKNAKFAVIIGQKEVIDGTAIIRDMDAGTQEIIDVRKVVHELQKKLGKAV
ncbi:histidine--tRNA ligase [Patescibacteria group bacterium]|nr:histidine--tRNA ligase [Patescibacteria group bacterium]